MLEGRFSILFGQTICASELALLKVVRLTGGVDKVLAVYVAQLWWKK
jgi:hypothetical protein